MTADVRKLPAGFGRLWTAQTVSSLGDGVTHAAFPLLALTLTRDPMALAVVTAAGTLPWLLFGVIGGALVDRWDRRRTMWVADVARAVLLAIPVGAAAFGVLSIPLLAAVAFLLGLGGLFFDTAATAYLPDLLGREPALLERANSRLRGAQTAMAGFAGPPAGSALLSLGRAAPLLADAVSFALSALLVRSLPAMPRPVTQARESLLRQARAGASYVFRDQLLLGLALRPAIGNIAFTAVGTVLALFAHDRLGIATYGFGLLLTAEATGGLIGAAIASFLGRRLGTGTALTCTAAVEGLAVLGLAAAPNPYVAGLALAACGAAMGATMVLAPSLRQAIVPAHLIGRVASTSRMLAMCAAPVGAFLAGWLAATFDVRTPLYVAAGLLLAMTAVTATMTSNRRVEAALCAAAPAQPSSSLKI
ncbi:putative MFS transporter [Actinoplanes missouriensis 431]|uniref:Putative MFS transporter n=1 Tax=Actinoplanes missouriensis (strain ATCC 14538 / DSM 43046 / CBS 188.64 / JCM 3121 / NBRC 102363 / NCIMB 12654 / NRRL B-3342 / UNCC 431) TaxID=512565 RepID=I0H535_ACTM4|nr:MFS transporter [Actinoplanes missouriensis]BAL88122.1 putative MFS transporter [Actinoplanes missouriensis 431]